MQISTDYISHAPAITAMFTACFADAEGPEEGAVIGQLVHRLIVDTPAPDLRGFTIWDNSTLAGGIFMSRLVYPNDARRVFLLSPVAIATQYQRRGLGQKLITFACDRMKQDGIDMILTYGDPAYYGRVGFRAVTPENIPAPYDLQHPHGWLCRPLNADELPKLMGPAQCVPAFQNPDLW